MGTASLRIQDLERRLQEGLGRGLLELHVVGKGSPAGTRYSADADFFKKKRTSMTRFTVESVEKRCGERGWNGWVAVSRLLGLV